MITIYTLAYNEELLIQFMIDHYRARFPDCRIVVDVDQMTNDNTIQIARKNNCEIRHHYVYGVRDEPLTHIKNTCWKEAATDWVLVCDMDELLEIDERDLQEEERRGTSMIRSEGYDMIDMEDKLDLPQMKYGTKQDYDNPLEKCLLFNKKRIQQINYSPGAHHCSPIGTIVHSKSAYKLYHYCYIHYDATLKKYTMLQEKKSPEDIRDSIHFYQETPEQIKDLYTQARNTAIKVR